MEIADFFINLREKIHQMNLDCIREELSQENSQYFSGRIEGLGMALEMVREMLEAEL